MEVKDTLSPVISLTGAAEITLAVGATFTDPGSSVSDSFEGSLSATVTGTVDTSTPGTHILKYNASDSTGNPATEVIRTVNVTDQTGPVITLSGPVNQGGANFMDHEAGVAYVDPGTTATDNVDGTVPVITTGTVDVSTLGTYTLTFNATDAAGNAAAPVTRTVVVRDTIAPVITLTGAAEITLAVGDTFTDPGSSVSDSFETGLSATATGTVDSRVLSASRSLSSSPG